MPGCDSGTISDIVPCIVGHDNSTEENSEYSTQFKQLHKRELQRSLINDKNLSFKVIQYESRKVAETENENKKYHFFQGQIN